MAGEEPIAAHLQSAAELNGLAIKLYRAGQTAAAIETWRRALEMAPDLAEVAGNLGVALQELGLSAEAEAAHRRSVALKPSDPDAWYNFGLALHAAGAGADALAAYERGLALDSRHVGALYNSGLLLKDLGRLDEAIARHRRVLALDPTHLLAREELMFELRQACDWRDLAAIEEAAHEEGGRALAAGRPIAAPFLLVTRSSDAPAHLRNAQLWALRRFARIEPMSAVPRTPDRGGRITVGYLSSDFHDHATAHLLGRLFALHDRDRFRIHAYSYGPDDGSAWRQRLVGDCDAFVGLEGLGDAAAAQRIRDDGVDILVDLKGWTQGSRLGICARRPAPLQVAYLGFPGTSGVPFIDYAIVDRVVAPPGDDAVFSEKLVRMPHSYQVNETASQISADGPTRAEVALPGRGIVFASFNQPYKIEPELFDVWAHVLAELSGAVLWLLDTGELARANLRREAAARGIDPGRLVFAPRWPKDRHLARLPLADMVLDTRMCCGHTSTSDALSVGVPVIGFRGAHFASRVTASCLAAVGAPELANNDLAGYERQALALARDPDALRALRARLSANRLTHPLFDTAGFARDLERAYGEMWRLWLAGEPPRALTLTGAAAG